MIKEMVGDALTYDGVLCHQVNCKGVMGAGIAKSIRKSLLSAKHYKHYQMLCSNFNKNHLLGHSLYCEIVPEKKYVANCFAQDGYGCDMRKTDYTALFRCMEDVKRFAKTHGNLNVIVPGLIGCGLAGGDWKHVYQQILTPLFADSIIELDIVYFSKELYAKHNSQTFTE